MDAADADDNAELLELCQERLGYRFRDPQLLVVALTHRSYVNECASTLSDNERFEFLGDAVLGLVISHELVRVYPNLPEGRLTKYKARIVNERSLARIASSLGIGAFLRLGRGEEQTGGRQKASILADAIEALIGAVFLDAGYDTLNRVVLEHFRGAIEHVPAGSGSLDFKSALQERVQALYRDVPDYQVIDQRGPDHDKRFEVTVSIAGTVVAHGVGRSKKAAEKHAAEVALRQLEAEKKAKSSSNE
ncbi:MAG: ribonuclease III [Myxococcales bacterium]|nr:ribonuclease III [Myxococcales bacterium]